MVILIIEDRGSTSKYMEDALRQQGHTILSAFNINDARTHLRRNPVQCMIADLNMAPDGLTDNQKVQTNNGMFTGWIWLRDEVYPEYPKLRSATIIYSEYLPKFHSGTMMTREDTAGITMIEKRGGEGATGVLNAVARIAAGLGA